MNEMMIFENEQFGQIRTLEKEGQPWFVAADVCRALELGNPTQILTRLDEDERTLISIEGASNGLPVNAVNEPGLYSLILGSRKPEAKAFKRWITHEVIPSIRKTGGYIAGAQQLSPEELMAQALLVAQRTLADREARISALTVENQIMQPKADYFDELVDRNLLTSFRDTAKALGVGPKSFVAFLLERKYVYRDKKGKLTPYEDKNDGLFEVKECFNEKTQWSGVQAMITPKGRETFRLLCNGLM
jgi:prophage antirepressor-like protein